MEWELEIYFSSATSTQITIGAIFIFTAQHVFVFLDGVTCSIDEK